MRLGFGLALGLFSGGAPPLSISPSVVSLATGSAQVFSAAGGSGGYTYTMTAGSATGSRVTSSGILICGPKSGTVTVRVTDGLGHTADATVTVTGIGANLKLWTRADLGITVATGVSHWLDQISGYDFAQPTAGAQPAVHANAINGNTTLTFAAAASSNLASTATLGNLFTTTNASVIVVAKYTGSASAPSDGYKGAGTFGSSSAYVTQYACATEVGAYTSNGVSPFTVRKALTSGSPYYATQYIDGIDSFVRVNGGAYASTPFAGLGAGYATTTLYVGVGYPEFGAPAFLDGEIGEVFAGQLTEGERLQIEAYIKHASNWGI